MATDDKKRPALSLGPYPCGGGAMIEGAVWDNEIDTDDGKKTVYAVSFSKNYREGDEWKKTKNLRLQDIPVLIYLLQKAQAFLMDKWTKEGD